MRACLPRFLHHYAVLSRNFVAGRRSQPHVRTFASRLWICTLTINSQVVTIPCDAGILGWVPWSSSFKISRMTSTSPESFGILRFHTHLEARGQSLLVQKDVQGRSIISSYSVLDFGICDLCCCANILCHEFKWKGEWHVKVFNRSLHWWVDLRSCEWYSPSQVIIADDSVLLGPWH